jgi:hypothetical protein
VASLLTASAEVKRLGAELSARLREPVRASKGARKPEPAIDLGPALAIARERSAALGAKLESLERMALRAALELAAEGIAERREAGPWLDRVQTLRHVSLGARAVREESEAFAEELTNVLANVSEARSADEGSAAPAALPGDIAAMAERVEQWGSDAHSRSERLSALAQRLASEFSEALGAARSSADELAGLASRFEARASSAAGEEAARERVAAWPAGSRPLRLLTREDVVPEDDENGSSQAGAPRDG